MIRDSGYRVLPVKVLRVNNEDVIDDLEGQVRRILQYIDIPSQQFLYG